MGRSSFKSIFYPVIPILVLLIATFSFDPLWYERPPFWDSILGVFREAIWLVDNRWNIDKFLFEEGGYTSGGARTYLISLYPWLLSALYEFFGNPQVVFMAMHGLSLLLASGVLFVVSRTLLSAGFTKMTSAIMTTALACHPLFLSQTCAMNMEMPLLFFNAMSVHFFLADKIAFSLVFLLVGFFVKASAFVVGLAICACLLLERIVFGRKIVTAFWLYQIPTALYLAYSYCERHLFFKGGADGTLVGSQAFRFPEILKYLFLLRKDFIALQYFPGTFLVMFCSFIVVVVFVVGICVSRKLRSFAKLQQENEILFRLKMFAISSSAILYLLFCFHTFPLYRYVLWTLPYIMLSLAFIGVEFLGRTERSFVLLFCIFVTSAYMPNFAEKGRERNNGYSLEDTLTQQMAIVRDQEVAKELEASFSDLPIITSIPYFYMLNDSRYGYVRQRLKVTQCDIRSCNIDPKWANMDVLVLDANNCFSSQIRASKSFITQSVYSVNGHNPIFLKVRRKG